MIPSIMSFKNLLDCTCHDAKMVSAIDSFSLKMQKKCFTKIVMLTCFEACSLVVKVSRTKSHKTRWMIGMECETTLLSLHGIAPIANTDASTCASAISEVLLGMEYYSNSPSYRITCKSVV